MKLDKLTVKAQEAIAAARDAAMVGLALNTAIAQATQIYLRYDGEIGTGTDNHALSAGIRMSW